MKRTKIGSVDPDPDPYCEYGSGSTLPNEYGSNTDPDPQPCTEGLPVLSIPPLTPPPEPPRQTAPQVAAADAQPIDFLELSFAQPSCPEVQAMLASSSLSVVSKKVGTVEVLGDVSTDVYSFTDSYNTTF